MIHKCPHCSKQFEMEVRFTKGPTTQSERAVSPPADTSDVGELLDRINDRLLEGMSVDFVAETRKRFAQYGNRIRMSEKQMAWLTKIGEGQDGEIAF